MEWSGNCDEKLTTEAGERKLAAGRDEMSLVAMEWRHSVGTMTKAKSRDAKAGKVAKTK